MTIKSPTIWVVFSFNIMKNTNDLAKRAEQIINELSVEDKTNHKTNLVAKAIIELVKERKTTITYKEVSNKIQNTFGLKNDKPYIVYHEGAMADRLFDIIKLCRNEKKEIPISILIDNGTKSSRDGFCDGYKEIYGKKYNLENLKKDQQETIKKICNGEYDFLLKPIPILDKIKIENLIDEETENIKDENERNNINEIRNEATILLRNSFPQEEKNKIHRRAQNKCEYCGCETFEKKNGEMYFEIHHIVHYSDGGENSAQNCVLLCPNCHRKIHFAKEEIVKNMKEKLQNKN